MTAYSIAPAARQDLHDIIDYVAAHDPDAARRVLEALSSAFSRLSRHPALGHARPDLTAQPVRFWPVLRRYTVTYRETRGMIEIVRVFSAGQDIASHLDDAFRDT
ncbi:MAG TPA: type II toxin-antitoxin system RelE/ParE family toxin [Caulobacter sp.]|nr:type II toxin-antitoxin system RelE/ParE family toxin [Caulobacter sp.]